MDEVLQLGHMEVASDQDAIDGYFLPHHYVLEENITTRLRVVLDASAKTPSGYSINDCLMVGPTIQQDLFSVLIIFRTHKIALTTDISKIYRKVRNSEADRKYYRMEKQSRETNQNL